MDTNKSCGALYVRVSTFNQVDKSSLKTQEERLKAYCSANGINKVKLYRDAGFSAKDTKRPAFENLMNEIKLGQIKTVLVTKLDRITRSLRDLIDLIDCFKKYDVEFISITESIDTGSPMGRFMQHLLGLVAQLEREVTAERVSIDMHHRAKKGKWNGGIVPFGYATQSLLINKYLKLGMNQNDAQTRALKICPEPKKLFVDPDESVIVQWIFNTFIEKNSVRKTAILLNDRGIKTRKSFLWPQSTIHRILRSPVYIGKISYGKRKTDIDNGKLIPQKEESWTIVNGEHDPIITEEIFNQAQQKLKQVTRKPTKKGRNYLLKGLIKCGHCGGSLAGHTFKKKESDKSYSYYKCVNKQQKGKTACRGLSLPVDAIEDFIIQNLKDLSNKTDFLADKEKMINLFKSKLDKTNIEPDITQLDNDLNRLKSSLDRLMDKLESGVIEDDDFHPRYIKIKEQIRATTNEKERILALAKSKESSLATLETSFDGITSFYHNWEYLDEAGKALRLSAIVKEIRATKEDIEMDIYLDVAKPSLMDTDSWRRPA